MVSFSDSIESIDQASIAQHIERVEKSIRQTKHKKLNIMVCGASGIGKTSFVKLLLRKFNHRRSEEAINRNSTVGFVLIF